MNSRSHRRHLFALAIVGATVVLPACAATVPSPASPAAASPASAPPAAGSASAAAVASHPAMQTVQRVFDAMRARDTATMGALFAEGAALASWSMRNGQPVVRRDSMTAFLRSVASAPAGLLLDERIYNARLEVADGLASAWMEYDFYAGDRFSHCGVNAIHLARHAGDQWKIVHVTDTRSPAGCPTR